MICELRKSALVGLNKKVPGPAPWLSNSLFCLWNFQFSAEKPELGFYRNRIRKAGTNANSEGLQIERENLFAGETGIPNLNLLVEIDGSKIFCYFFIIETRWLLHNSLAEKLQPSCGCYMNLIRVDTMRRLIEYYCLRLEFERNLSLFKQPSCNDVMIVLIRSLTSPDFLLDIIYTILKAHKSGMVRLGSSNLVALLQRVPMIIEVALIVKSNIGFPNQNLESQQTLSEGPWIQSFAKVSKGEKSEGREPASHESSTSGPLTVEQKPDEPKSPAPKKDPRVVHDPVTPYHGLPVGSRVHGFLLHPGDIMITHRSRPPYDPPGDDPGANPGGHCTLFVDHEYFERRQKEVYMIEHMMDKAFDDGDIILRFGSFDIYWSWSPLRPIECFEFQYHTSPASWFLFSRVQWKPLPSPPKTWNRRWMVVGRQQPDPPDTQAIIPRLGDVIIRRAEAVVWWQLNFKLQTGDLLIRAGYERVANSIYTLAAVEMYECHISSFEQFTGPSYITRYHTNWTFLGRDMQVYGDGRTGGGGLRIQYNGPVRHPLSNRNDYNRNESM